MWERGEMTSAIAYVLSSVGIGVLGLFAGMYLIRHVA